MNTWKLSAHGIRTVVLLDLRQRVRSRKWIGALVGWFVLIVGLSALLIAAISYNEEDLGYLNQGTLSFGLVVFMILGLSLVIAPTFTATSINGDRDNGTLALLQATRLSAADIVTGKLIAAWIAAALFFAVSLPVLIWALVAGSISVWQVIVCFAVMFVEVAVVCAIGLGWSSLMGRPAGSTVLTYLTVAVLTVLTPVLLGIASLFTMREDTVRVWDLPAAVQQTYGAEVDQYWSDHPDGDGSGIPAPPVGRCVWTTEKVDRYHADQFWWLVAPNPFVVVADAAPLPASARSDLSTYVANTSDPLAELQLGVRTLRSPAPTDRDGCAEYFSYSGAYYVNRDAIGNIISVTTLDGTAVPYTSPVKTAPVTVDSPIWPWGLGFSILLGAGFFWIAVHRLRVPYGTLSPGTRVA